MDALIELGVKASELTLTLANAVSEVSAWRKDDRSLVTVGDFAVQTLVAERLADGSIPGGTDFPLVAEERLHDVEKHGEVFDAVVTALRPHLTAVDRELVKKHLSRRRPASRLRDYWCLDPIDGTRGYVNGRQYALSLSLVRDGRPQLGLLCCPRLTASTHATPDEVAASGVVLFAERGQGGIEVELDGSARRALANSPANIDKLRVAVPVEKSHSDAATMVSRLREICDEVELCPVDSQAKYALVAQN